MNEKTYIKLNFFPTTNIAIKRIELLSKNFPPYNNQLSYLAKFTKDFNGEEQIVHDWLKSNLSYKCK